MNKVNMICISCPMGCMMSLDVDDEKNIVNIEGNSCPRGLIYAKNEVKHPKRIVTSTIKVNSKITPRVSVKTKDAIPKDKIFKVMDEINKKVVKAPINIGDVLIKNVCNTKVDVVATSKVER